MGSFCKTDNFIAGRSFDHKQFLCSEVSPLSLWVHFQCTTITNHTGGRGKVSAKLPFIENISVYENQGLVRKLVQNQIKTENKGSPKSDRTNSQTTCEWCSLWDPWKVWVFPTGRDTTLNLPYLMKHPHLVLPQTHTCTNSWLPAVNDRFVN